MEQELTMFDYWVGKHGLEEAVERSPLIAADPAIAAARLAIENAERAILARVEELRVEHY